jgi:hypothetical protein
VFELEQAIDEPVDRDQRGRPLAGTWEVARRAEDYPYTGKVISVR